MTSNEDVHEDLQNVLSKFKLEELKEHAMKDFPEGSWSGICKIVENAREDLKPKSVASAIVKLVKRNRLNANELHGRINVLKLRACGLSTTKTWFAYEMTEQNERHDSSFQQLVSRMEHLTRASVFAIRAAHDYDSILLGVKRGRQVVTVCIADNYLLVCPRTNNIQMLEAIAKGMGYDSLKNCRLSGRHIPSLLRILEQKKGATHFEGVISSPKYRALPRKTRSGLDFTAVGPKRNYLDRLRGEEENAPSLQQLTLHTKAPYKNDNHVYSTAILGSSNVELSLRDMAAANIIPLNSVFFSMINKHCKNEMKIKIV